jgi:lysophospholipase L1-like esterase
MINVHNGYRLVETGDSLTNLGIWDVAGGLIDQLNRPLWVPGTTNPAMISGGGKVTVSGGGSGFSGAITRLPLIVTNTGINGNNTGDLAASVQSRIVQYNPDVVLILIGINDIVLMGWTVAHTLINYDSILSQVRSSLPNAQIGCVGIVVDAETWASAPLRWSAGNDVVDDRNAGIASLCTTYNATYIDIRSSLLIWESTNNTPEPGTISGKFTSDGVHPIVPSGQLLASGWARPYFTSSP